MMREVKRKICLFTQNTRRGKRSGHMGQLPQGDAPPLLQGRISSQPSCFPWGISLWLVAYPHVHSLKNSFTKLSICQGVTWSLTRSIREAEDHGAVNAALSGSQLSCLSGRDWSAVFLPRSTLYTSKLSCLILTEIPTSRIC